MYLYMLNTIPISPYETTMQPPSADKNGRNVDVGGNAPKFSNTLIRKLTRKIMPHPHPIIIPNWFFCFKAVPKTKSIKTVQTQHTSIATIIPYVDDKYVSR